ncbi:MAG: WbuC family cupin fold metalloprotein [bacterium]|jgi:cupin fold WbuC family metalloprotein|nr:WbuC family cupin fold metalloprotein [Betaproteobacteria bacterium]
MSARWIDARMFDALSASARASTRRRKNQNFHPSNHYPSNRLLNAIEPDSYVPPHRHLDPTKDETLFVLRGAIGVLLFDEAGTVLDQRVLRAGGDCVGIDIPHGVIHSLVALEEGTVVFEAKAGPFVERMPVELAAFAPPEDAPDAVGFLHWMRSRFD